MSRKRKTWGWGFEDEGLDRKEREQIVRAISSFLALDDDVKEQLPVLLEQAKIPASKATAPNASRPGLYSTSPYDRAVRAYGRSYRDLVRARSGDYSAAPDLVALPADVDELIEVLEHCDRNNLAAIPFGGGTSVVGGVEAAVPPGYDGTMSIDLTGLDRVYEVDDVSLAVHAEGGVFGPELEKALRPHGLTLRHYPQSFYYSTLGGWIATRSGGHYSMLYGKIDEMVESLGVLTPSGLYREQQLERTRRLPSSSIGPDPNRMWIGSEGALGIITDAWVRVHRIPRHRADATIRFESFEQACVAQRAIAQSKLYPATSRVLDPYETVVSAVFSGKGGIMGATYLLGFESADHPVGHWMQRALEICRDHGGGVLHQLGTPAAGQMPSEGGDDAKDGWRQTFFRQPFVRDVLVGMGVIADTFETAITWDKFDTFYQNVREKTNQALKEVCGGGGVLARTTHVYADGAALYFSFFGQATRGNELEQWAAIKQAASDAIIEEGGTISHHHAAGRDHRQWAAQEIPPHYQAAFFGAKKELDPKGIMNPGVIFDLPQQGGDAPVANPA